jgi:signal transduction histidine kinase
MDGISGRSLREGPLDPVSDPTIVSRRPLVSRLRAGQWFAVAGGIIVVLLAASFALGTVAIVRLTDARHRVVDQIGPTRVAAQQLLTSLVDQETGLRGYALTGDRTFLDPYRRGVRDQRDFTAQLQTGVADIDDPTLTAEYDAVRRAVQRWNRDYVQVALGKGRDLFDTAATEAGRQRFNEVRIAYDRFQADLQARRTAGRADLASSAHFLTWSFIVIAALLLIAFVGLALLLRQIVSKPLARLSRETRTTASGDFGHVIHGDGARDIVDLGEDIGALRRRVVRELEALQEANQRLDEQALDLRRSNAELEQFAYVASHDLQEPLRKVASFTQLLQRRYGDQLDERADQYIDFAVDGAKRMQQLINDLLAFSRVGRLGTELEPVDMNTAAAVAVANLTTSIDETGAQVDVGPLPEVRGEPSLLAAVFQNLIGNAVKFHGDAAPVVRVSAERDGDMWRFTVADNGIGIDPEYADRIFVIFQRLHPKEAYGGTGIGLALCRKIVEFHGGRIELDTSVHPGTTFRFTLPAIDQNGSAP